jgi:hypothetical protein
MSVRPVGLGSAKVMTFVPTRDAQRAKAFYGSVLGLRLLSEDSFALAFDANGIILRVTNVPEFKPQMLPSSVWRCRTLAELLRTWAKAASLAKNMVSQDRTSVESGRRLAAPRSLGSRTRTATS